MAGPATAQSVAQPRWRPCGTAPLAAILPGQQPGLRLLGNTWTRHPDWRLHELSLLDCQPADTAVNPEPQRTSDSPVTDSALRL